MLKIVRDITEFHEAPLPDEPGFPDPGRIEHRKNLIREEVGKTLVAIDDRNMVDVTNGIVDSLVALIGTAREFGIDLNEVLRP